MQPAPCPNTLRNAPCPAYDSSQTLGRSLSQGKASLRFGADVPNPKGNAESNSAATWYEYYASFSEAFVRKTLSAIDCSPGSVVLDPWNGAGTTTSVAHASGISAIGVDVNPVMAIIARARIGDSGATLVPSQKDFEAPVRSDATSGDPLAVWLTPASVELVRRFQAWIDPQLMGSRMARQPTSESMAGPLCFRYVCLFDALRGLLKRFKSSNPTWVRVPKRRGEEMDITPTELLDAFSDSIKRLHRIRVNGSRAHRPSLSLLTASSNNLPLEPDSIDAIVTSPPYCTRLDYAVSTRIELAVLGYDWNQVQALRLAMIGTPRVAPDGPQLTLPSSCTRALEAIRAHPSKASAGYYYRTYRQYFEGISQSLTELRRVLRTGGQAVFVVQDSYYKGIHVDLPVLFSDMCAAAGMSLEDRRDFKTKVTMRSIHPQHATYAPRAHPVESVLITRATSQPARATEVSA